MPLRIIVPFILGCFIIACKSSSPIPQNAQKPKQSYQSIKSNVARVQAMLTGKFVQQTLVDSLNNYQTWKVNDNQDSMLLYSIPVGDPNKIGYWIYHYQIMTSLPNEPIYEAFEKLTEIDRDSIKSTLYLSPADFNRPLDDLITQRENAFENIDFSTFNTGEDAGYYIRQNLLFFLNQTDVKKNEEYKVYAMDRYELYPDHMLFFTLYYKDPKGERFISQEVSKFIKQPD